MQRVPVKIADGETFQLSPGEHSELIRAMIEEFAPRFAPGSVLIYAGDTGEKMGYFNAALLASWGSPSTVTAKCPTWCSTTPIGCFSSNP
jgi:hypothetical protein